MSYAHDRERVDPFTPQVRSILGGLPLAHFAEVQNAPIEMDVKCATDLTLKITGGDIAIRLRFPSCTYRDFTIRSHRNSGAKTELAKIREGYAYRYFYGWIDKTGTVAQWILVDLDRVREKGVLKEKWPEYPNKDQAGKPDGTFFIAIPLAILGLQDCLIARSHKTLRELNPQASLADGIERARHVKSYLPRVTE